MTAQQTVALMAATIYVERLAAGRDNDVRLPPDEVLPYLERLRAQSVADARDIFQKSENWGKPIIGPPG